MAKKTKENTKHKIIRVATRMFLEKGYTDTSVKMVSDELGISKGNFTFHFPSKEHILAELVEMLCKFQWMRMGEEAIYLFSVCHACYLNIIVCRNRVC